MCGFDWAEEKLHVPYLTSYCWNLELVVLDVSLSLSYHQTDNPLKVREGTTASSIYTVVPYLADRLVLSFLLPFQIEPESTESVVMKQKRKASKPTNQPTNQ